MLAAPATPSPFVHHTHCSVLPPSSPQLYPAVWTQSEVQNAQRKRNPHYYKESLLQARKRRSRHTQPAALENQANSHVNAQQRGIKNTCIRLCEFPKLICRETRNTAESIKPQPTPILVPKICATMQVPAAAMPATKSPGS